MRQPLFIRFCAAFVDNLAMILRVGLVVGGIFLVRELQEFNDKPGAPSHQPEPVIAESTPTPVEPIEAEESLLTPGVLHALKCTHKEYRDKHFDECVDDESQVYQRPGADPDDTGYVIADVDALYASALSVTTDR